MTRKDYELIAQVISDYGLTCPENIEYQERRKLAALFAEQLEKDNPKFDRDTFFEACGV